MNSVDNLGGEKKYIYPLMRGNQEGGRGSKLFRTRGGGVLRCSQRKTANADLKQKLSGGNPSAGKKSSIAPGRGGGGKKKRFLPPIHGAGGKEALQTVGKIERASS